MGVIVFLPYRWDLRIFLNLLKYSEVTDSLIALCLISSLSSFTKYLYQFSCSVSLMVSIDGNSLFDDNKTTFLNAKFYSYVLTDDSNRINKSSHLSFFAEFQIIRE